MTNNAVGSEDPGGTPPRRYFAARGRIVDWDPVARVLRLDGEACTSCRGVDLPKPWQEVSVTVIGYHEVGVGAKIVAALAVNAISR